MNDAECEMLSSSSAKIARVILPVFIFFLIESTNSFAAGSVFRCFQSQTGIYSTWFLIYSGDKVVSRVHLIHLSTLSGPGGDESSASYKKCHNV